VEHGRVINHEKPWHGKVSAKEDTKEPQEGIKESRGATGLDQGFSLTVIEENRETDILYILGDGRTKDAKIKIGVGIGITVGNIMFSRTEGGNLSETRHNPHDIRGLTLIELLVVVLIIAILAAIAVVNFLEAQERGLRAANASNLRTIAIALQMYHVDHNTLPLADHEAGPFSSSDPAVTQTGNAPAGGGSWAGLPWILFELKYLSDWQMMFNPRYLKLYRGGETIRGGHPRFHNFRYAYNSSSVGSGGHTGGDGNIMEGNVWMVRDLYLGPLDGFYGGSFPNHPADFHYPWGPDRNIEHTLYADGTVRLVQGKTDTPPDEYGF
jgi:prepilin-type N-terminal cleavage/methylation domain-containing protein